MAITKLDRLRKEMDSAIEGGDFDLAFQVVNDMLDIDPENSQFWNSKGVILSKMDRPDDALLSFDRSLEMDPEDPRTWYSKGCVLMDEGEHRLALACLYKSLDLDPAMEKARERFLRCLDEWVKGRDAEEGDHSDSVEGPDGPWSEDEETMIRGDEDVIQPPEEKDLREPVSSMTTQEIIRRREEKGSFLDDDLFVEGPSSREDDGSAEREAEEEWPEEDLEGWEEDWPQEDSEEGPGDEDGSEDWSEEVELWTEQADEEEEPIPLKHIRCRCGKDIPIYSADRPLRFECPSCSRTGTLRN